MNVHSAQHFKKTFAYHNDLDKIPGIISSVVFFFSRLLMWSSSQHQIDDAILKCLRFIYTSVKCRSKRLYNKCSDDHTILSSASFHPYVFSALDSLRY